MAKRIQPVQQGETTYRSGFEAQIAEHLQEHKVKFKYEEDIITYIEPAKTRKYVADFSLPNNIIIEAKGRFTVHDRKKMILVMEQNPKLDIRMLFQRDQKLNKGAKTKYSEWCEKRGIKYAIGEIPQEWLDEKPKRRKTK